MKLKIFLAGLVALFIIAYVYQRTHPLPNVAFYNNPNQTIYVSADHTDFVISQPANPTTGYTWKVTGYDAQLITFIKSDYVKPFDTKRVGTGGNTLLGFRATPALISTPGKTTTIQLRYAQPWDPNNSATQLTFTVAAK